MPVMKEPFDGLHWPQEKPLKRLATPWLGVFTGLKPGVNETQTASATRIWELPCHR